MHTCIRYMYQKHFNWEQCYQSTWHFYCPSPPLHVYMSMAQYILVVAYCCETPCRRVVYKGLKILTLYIASVLQFVFSCFTLHWAYTSLYFVFHLLNCNAFLYSIKLLSTYTCIYLFLDIMVHMNNLARGILRTSMITLHV